MFTHRPTDGLVRHPGAPVDVPTDAPTDRLPPSPAVLPAGAVHPFAARCVWPIAVVVAVAHLVAALRPGWWFDEATTVALGRDHLMWGYADQPPLAPVLAAAADALAPDSMLALRLPAVLATAAAAVVAALVARELGGDRRAQTLTAIAQATVPWGALTGHWATPYALEPVLWLILGWLLVRWVRTRDDRLLLGLGVVTGVAAETRFQVLLLGAVVLLCVLVVGPRALLARPMLWVGVLLAALIALPTLLWQASAGWPQLAMGPIVAGEATELYGGRPGVAALSVLAAGVPGAVLAVYGTGRLLADRALRFVGATLPILLVFFVVTGGRPYYVAGLWGIAAAAGAVGLQRRREAGARRWRWVAWPASAVGVGLAAATVWVSPTLTDPGAGQTIAGTAASVYRGLPEADRPSTAVFGQSYIQAAFLDTYGRSAGLPPAHSTNRSYGYLPPPPESQDRVLYLGSTWPAELQPYFPDIRLVADAGPDAKVWLASGRVQPWSAIWPGLRHLDVR